VGKDLKEVGYDLFEDRHSTPALSWRMCLKPQKPSGKLIVPQRFESRTSWIKV